MVQAQNPRTWELEARRSAQGHPLLHSKFKASLSYMSPSLNTYRGERERGKGVFSLKIVMRMTNISMFS